MTLYYFLIFQNTGVNKFGGYWYSNSYSYGHSFNISLYTCLIQSKKKGKDQDTDRKVTTSQ